MTTRTQRKLGQWLKRALDSDQGPFTRSNEASNVSHIGRVPCLRAFWREHALPFVVFTAGARLVLIILFSFKMGNGIINEKDI
jgi:hypothetical protein